MREQTIKYLKWKRGKQQVQTFMKRIRSGFFHEIEQAESQRMARTLNERERIAKTQNPLPHFKPFYRG